MRLACPCLLVGLGLLGACDPAGDDPFPVTCQPSAPSAEAQRGAGPDTTAEGAGWILPGGRALLPLGTLLPLGGFPLALRTLPPPLQRHVVVSNGGYGDNGLLLVDTAATPQSAVASRVPYPAGLKTRQSPALFYGLQVAPGSLRVFASGGGYEVPWPDDPRQPAHVIDTFSITVRPQPALVRDQRIFLPAGPGGLRYPAGLYLSQDEQRLYVAGQGDGSLIVLSAAPGPGLGRLLGSIETLGRFPYDVVVDETHRRAYVSLWGGESVVGMATPRDGLVAVDVAAPERPARVSGPGLDLLLRTGKGSEQLLLAGSTLYIAAADADRVSALDLGGLAMPEARTADLTLPNEGRLGASPNALALDPERGRLYVANANDNALTVLDAKSLAVLGRLPTAAYPTGVAVLSDGTVVVACAKGSGNYPTDRLPVDGNPYEGLLQVLPRPSEQDLALGERRVAQANGRPRAYQATPACAAGSRGFPLPLQVGDPTPIKHVFLVVRENKTYDAVLGDLPGTRGEPKLVLFGEDNTPNLHALARGYANLDNFYANADQSIQGHQWTTSAISNDFTEKVWSTIWGRGTRSQAILAGSTANDYTVTGGSGSVFQALDRAGISYHNYGEIVNTTSARVKLDNNYPGVTFNLEEPDVHRADYIVSRLLDPTEEIERFHYILMPRDHTYGTTPGKPTPQSMIADNDEALGRFIDGLSRSPYWQDSVVFVIEDDPSDGADHVDQHRSICVAIGPWIRRGYVSSVNYDDPSLWHTIELLLGLPPLNSLDASSAAMYDLFASQPDLTPYTFIPRRVPEQLNPQDAPLARESMAIDFSRPDTAPLGHILWRAIRGTEPPFGTGVRDDDD